MTWQIEQYVLPKDISPAKVQVKKDHQYSVGFKAQDMKQIRLIFANYGSNDQLLIKNCRVTTDHFADTNQLVVTQNSQTLIVIDPNSEGFSDLIELPVTNVDYHVTWQWAANYLIGSRSSFWQNSVFDGVYEEKNPDLQVMYGLCGIQVDKSSKYQTIAAFGDSITNYGYWTSAFCKSHPNIGLLNLGIAGNRLLFDSAPDQIFGNAGLKRFETECFRYELPDLITIMEGVNDITQPGFCAPISEEVTAQSLFKGMQRLATIAHAHQVPIVACTILPFGNFNMYLPEKDAVRIAFNQLLLTANCFDYVVNLESMANKIAPSKLDLRYDCGDGLHPNQSGGNEISRIMSKAIDEGNAFNTCLTPHSKVYTTFS